MYLNIFTHFVFMEFSANWVTVFGTKYQLPFGLVVGKSEDEEDLMFGEVVDILVADNHCIIFEFDLLEAEFLHHYHVYAVLLPPVPSRQRYLIKHSDLPCFQPLGLYHSDYVSDNSLFRYIIPKSNVYVP